MKPFSKLKGFFVQNVSFTLTVRLSFCMKFSMGRAQSFLFLLLSVSFVISCDGLKMPKNIFETSERVKYERSFSGADSLMVRWKARFSSAAASQLKIKDGSSFIVNSNNTDLHALGYALNLEKGDLLIIETDLNDPGKRIFIDIIDQESGSEIMKSAVVKNNIFSKAVEKSGWHKVIIQPEIEYRGTFGMKIYTQPSIGFPVAGKGNRDVQSFWGASRDKGARSHEGVDIFAARGTPVVAVAGGSVIRTGNQGLGGKQVWLRDGVTGNSYYYAHLDSVMTESGKQVKAGDTLGLVGNTGNAAGGAAHLHFGIYSTGGAVNPYPYIRKRAVPKSATVHIKSLSEKYIRAGTNIRSGAGTQFDLVSMVHSKTRVSVLASDGTWYHIKTSDNLEGFVIADRLEP